MRMGCLTILIFFACRKPQEEVSELKWGHLKTSQYDPSLWLISAPPHSVIEACGEQQNHAVGAMQKWAAAIGRSNYLKFVTCGSDPKATIKVTVQTSSCSGTAWADPPSRTIHLCSSANTIAMDQLLLHETGHIWGMCDQYEAGLSFCDTGHMTSQLPAKAVMKWYEQDLQQDDIDGLTNLINRSDIPANQVWKDFLASQGGGSGAGDIPASGSSSNELFFAIEDLSAPQANFYISAPQAILKVVACAGASDPCVNGSATRMTFSKFQETALRVIYKSDQKVSPADGEAYTLLGLGANDEVVKSVSLIVKERK